MSELKRTPLYQQHIDLGAKMVPFAGYEMPVQYIGLKEEHLNVRANVGLFDVSHMGEIRIKGAKALEIWSGKPAPVAIMRRALEKNIYGR